MIDRFIQEGVNFACYRRPGDNIYHLLIQKDKSLALFHDFSRLNGVQAYVFAPFHISPAHPVVALYPDEIRHYTLEPAGIPLFGDDHVYAPVSEKYSSHFNAFLNELNTGSLKKLVLSRSKRVVRDKAFSVYHAFIAACMKYVHSYVYVFHTAQTGTWIGCTPEILLSGNRDEWHTVALAGTQLLQDGRLPADWDEKNRIEQRWVTAYIKEQLHTLGVPFTESTPYTVPAGKLAHIKSDFRFKLERTDALGDVIGLFHPTPAVCGLPKDHAKAFILSTEKESRAYYSGFLGWLNHDEETELYVNLRCMKIEERHFTLFAGGGILPESSLEEEWKETENKMQTMLALTKIY